MILKEAIPIPDFCLFGKNSIIITTSSKNPSTGLTQIYFYKTVRTTLAVSLQHAFKSL